MRVLHLVSFCQKPHYERMAKATKPLYELDKEKVDTYYYFVNETDSPIEEPRLVDGNFLELSGKERGMTLQTIDALEYLFDSSRHEMVICSTVSTVIHFPVLFEALRKPHKVKYGGTHLLTKKQASQPPLVFAQGSCMILKQKAIKCLLKNKQELDVSLPHDESFALVLKQQLGMLPALVGEQGALFSPFHNVDRITSYRNHGYNSDRLEDVLNVERCASALQERTVLRRKQKVCRVWYHTRDVTNPIRRLCTLNEKTRTWVSAGNNEVLDLFFGDPAPNLFKLLTVVTEEVTFAQNAILAFSLSADNELFVE